VVPYMNFAKQFDTACALLAFQQDDVIRGVAIHITLYKDIIAIIEMLLLLLCRKKSGGIIVSKSVCMMGDTCANTTPYAHEHVFTLYRDISPPPFTNSVMEALCAQTLYGLDVFVTRQSSLTVF